MYINESIPVTITCVKENRKNSERVGGGELCLSYKLVRKDTDVNELASDCYLTPTQQFFSYIVARIS